MAGFLGFGHNFANSLGHSATLRGRRSSMANRKASAANAAAQAADAVTPSWRTSKWYKHGKRSLIASLSLGSFGLLAHRFLPRLYFGLSEWFRKGSRKKMSAVIAPDSYSWVGDMKLPSIRKKFDENDISETASTFKKLNFTVGQFMEGQRNAWKNRFGANQYLPEIHRKALNKVYRTPKYWWYSLVSPRKAIEMELAVKGPIPHKNIQGVDFAEQNEFLAHIESNLDKLAERKPQIKPMLPAIRMQLKAQIKTNEGLDKMKDSVGLESPQAYSKEINELIKQVENISATGNAPIKIDFSKVKPFKAASIGQICSAEDQNKTRYIIKLIRGNLSSEIKKADGKYLASSKQYLAYLDSIKSDQTTDSIRQVAQGAEGYANLLRDETKLPVEVQNTNDLGQRLEADADLKDVIKVPKIYGHTDDAILMEFVGTHNINELKGAEGEKWFKDSAETVLPAVVKLFHGSDIIPLDMHGGNVRVDIKKPGQIYAIDDARVARMKTGARENINALTNQFYISAAKKNHSSIANVDKDSKFDWNKQLFTDVVNDDDFARKLKAVLDLNSTGTKNKIYTDLLNKTARTDAEQAQLEGFVKELFMSKKPASAEVKVLEGLTGLELNEEKSNASYLHVWANVAEALPDTIMEGQLSREDKERYREKLTQMTRKFFKEPKKQGKRTSDEITAIEQRKAALKAEIMKGLTQELSQQGKLTPNEAKNLADMISKGIEQDLTA